MLCCVEPPPRRSAGSTNVLAGSPWLSNERQILAAPATYEVGAGARAPFTVRSLFAPSGPNVFPRNLRRRDSAPCSRFLFQLVLLVAGIVMVASLAGCGSTSIKPGATP